MIQCKNSEVTIVLAEFNATIRDERDENNIRRQELKEGMREERDQQNLEGNIKC